MTERLPAVGVCAEAYPEVGDLDGAPRVVIVPDQLDVPAEGPRTLVAKASPVRASQADRAQHHGLSITNGSGEGLWMDAHVVAQSEATALHHFQCVQDGAQRRRHGRAEIDRLRLPSAHNNSSTGVRSGGCAERLPYQQR